MSEQLQKETLMKQLAALEIAGVNRKQACEQLGITYSKARTLQESQAYKDFMDIEKDKDAALELSQAKTKLAKLVIKAIRAVERALDEGAHREALQAANVVFKATGIEAAEKKENDGVINIIMPNGVMQEVIQVKDEN